MLALYQGWLPDIMAGLIWFAALFALFWGLLFVVAPQLALGLNRGSARWISMRRSTHPLERLHHIEPWIYRHHRLVGSLLLIACAYLLHHLGFRYRHEQVLRLMGDSLLAEWLLDTAWWFVLLSTLAILGVAMVLALRPSALKGFEGRANRWLSSRRAMARLEQPWFGPDSLVARYPRRFGLLLLLAAAYLGLVASSVVSLA